MEIFEIVKAVLDQEYESILPEKERDQKIKNALNSLGTIYGKVKTHGGPDLSDPAIRFAYIYRYTTMHANIVFETIKIEPGLQELFKSNELKISCVGGGPGSDLLGVYKYVRHRQLIKPKEKMPNMTFHLLDKEDAWGESWSDVDAMTKSTISSSTMFRIIDVCDPESWEKHKKFLHADLFTFVYFFSELFSYKQKATPFFKNLLENAKKGAKFLIIDFVDSGIASWYDGLCSSAGLKVIHEDEDTFQLSADEDKDSLGKYFQKFNYPKLTAKLIVRVLEK
jgi:hypothetical protein